MRLSICMLSACRYSRYVHTFSYSAHTFCLQAAHSGPPRFVGHPAQIGMYLPRHRQELFISSVRDIQSRIGSRPLAWHGIAWHGMGVCGGGGGLFLGRKSNRDPTGHTSASLPVLCTYIYIYTLQKSDETYASTNVSNTAHMYSILYIYGTSKDTCICSIYS